jgi:hypothetical protein
MFADEVLKEFSQSCRFPARGSHGRPSLRFDVPAFPFFSTPVPAMCAAHRPVAGDRAMRIDRARDAASESSEDANAHINLAAMRGERFIVRREFERFS